MGSDGADGRLSDGVVPHTVTPLSELALIEAPPLPPDTLNVPLPEPGRGLEGGVGVEKHVVPAPDPIGSEGAEGIPLEGAVPQAVTPFCELPVADAAPLPPDTLTVPLPDPGNGLEGGVGVETHVGPVPGEPGSVGALGVGRDGAPPHTLSPF